MPISQAIEAIARRALIAAGAVERPGRPRPGRMSRDDWAALLDEPLCDCDDAACPEVHVQTLPDSTPRSGA